MGAIVERVLVIGGDAAVWAKLSPALLEDNRVKELRRLDHYPSSEELARVVRLFPPDVVFLGLESAAAASLVIAELEIQSPATPVVAFNRLDDSRTVAEWMRSGIREIVKPPFDREQIEETLRRMAAIADLRQPQRTLANLCAFLPARGGSGTSTLACHLARTLSSELTGRVLLADFDLISSPVRYLMNFHQGQTIRDAAELVDDMDPWRWEQVVAHLDKLDILNAGGLNLRRTLRTEMVRRLLDYASAQYKVVCADLSGNMEAYSLEVMRSAGAIFIVTTPDAMALGAARDKVDFLDSLGLKSRSGLLVRQAPQSEVPSAANIERACGIAVAGIFDYTDFNPKHETEESTVTPIPFTLRRQLVSMARTVADAVSRPANSLQNRPLAAMFS